jgi:hypothetical protein
MIYGAYRPAIIYDNSVKSDQFPNLTIRKIPKQALDKCEWGHDDYSLKKTAIEPPD